MGAVFPETRHFKLRADLELAAVPTSVNVAFACNQHCMSKLTMNTGPATNTASKCHCQQNRAHSPKLPTEHGQFSFLPSFLPSFLASCLPFSLLPSFFSSFLGSHPSFL